ncbi:MAG: MCE family protein [Deltaproteobacteria bacterium]|nr:MCE family protein [Deltaproteobacteria bacterium]
MANREEKDPRFKYLEQKVGLFILLVIAGLLAVIFFIGKERELFTARYNIHFIVPSGTGFIEGMPVKLSGFKIGKLKSLSLDENAKVKIVLDINKKYETWIRKGSVARLVKEGVIGEAVVEITVGPPSGTILANGSEITYEKVAGVEELAKEIKPIIKDVKEIIEYINDPDGNVKRTLSNIEEISFGLIGTREKMDGVLDEVKVLSKEMKQAVGKAQIIEDKAMPMVDNAAKVMKNIEAMTEKIEPIIDKAKNIAMDIENVTGKLPQVLEKANKILDDIKKTTNVIADKSPNIKDALNTADDMLQDTKEIVKGVKESWPVKNLIPEKEEIKLVPLEGLERKY